LALQGNVEIFLRLPATLGYGVKAEQKATLEEIPALRCDVDVGEAEASVVLINYIVVVSI